MDIVHDDGYQQNNIARYRGEQEQLNSAILEDEQIAEAIARSKMSNLNESDSLTDEQIHELQHYGRH